jgi:hypothetical protein
MTDTTTFSMWSTLVPVMVGGVIGLVGGWLGPWLVERRKEIAEQKKKRAEKFEELVATLFAYEHWLDSVQDIRLFSNRDELTPTLPPSPLARLHAISAVHFPQFESKIQELEDVGRKYEMWMIEARQKWVKNEKDYTAGHNEAYKGFRVILVGLLSDFKNYAKDEFQ